MGTGITLGHKKGEIYTSLLRRVFYWQNTPDFWARVSTVLNLLGGLKLQINQESIERNKCKPFPSEDAESDSHSEYDDKRSKLINEKSLDDLVNDVSHEKNMNVLENMPDDDPG